MDFKDSFDNYLKRIDNLKAQITDLAEEQTKNALVMPFFAMLGYDVFDTNEFTPEFVCDVGTKKGEKIDYAVLKDNEPIMLIEVKRAGMKLQKQQQSQLFRYFSTNRCRIAILTNGITYQFFSDLNAPNVMDDEPFLSFNLIDDDPTIYMSSIKQFCKDKFDIKSVISKAVYQKYAKVVEKTLKEDLINPSDELIKYFLTRPEIKTGTRITSAMIEKHREITKKSMQKVLGVSIVENIVKTVEPAQSEQAEPIEQKTEQPMTFENIVEKAKVYVAKYDVTPEDNQQFIRLHLYSNGSKTGVVKIAKSDLSIQYRDLSQGTPIVHNLSAIDELKSYI